MNHISCVHMIWIQFIMNVVKFILVGMDENLVGISKSNIQMTMGENTVWQKHAAFVKRLTLSSVQSQVVSTNDGELQTVENHWKD